MISTHHLVTALCLCLFCHTLQAQNTTSISYTADSIDADYGIVVYDQFCEALDGDKTRQCDGRPCNGWIEDTYTGSETKLHRGFYVNGKLTLFENFHPNGKLERKLVSSNAYNAQLRVYFDNGQERSFRKILNGNPIEWVDYYQDGQVEYKEVYNKKFEYYLEQAGYQADGTPEFEMEMTDKRHKIYYKTRYHDNGNKSEEGELFYYEDAGIYQRRGWWTVYNDEGIAVRKDEYGNGVIIRSSTLD